MPISRKQKYRSRREVKFSLNQIGKTSSTLTVVFINLNASIDVGRFFFNCNVSSSIICWWANKPLSAVFEIHNFK
jgi:hypothetical protein